jgi:hypothetical protein
MRNVLRSQHGHRIEGDVQLSVRSRLPIPIPQGFRTAPRRAAKAPHRSPKPDAGPLTLAAHGLALLASKASATHPARSCGSCIDCSGRSIPRRGELGDELKKPLQALREAGRAKPRWLFAVTFFRLQPKPDFRIQCLAARNALPQFSSPQPWFPLCIAAGRSFPSESEAGATFFVRGTQERSALARLAASRKNARTSPNNNAN